MFVPNIQDRTWLKKEFKNKALKINFRSHVVLLNNNSVSAFLPAPKAESRRVCCSRVNRRRDRDGHGRAAQSDLTGGLKPVRPL